MMTTFFMVNTEYLAIIAIFLTGFYLGIKVTQGVFKLKVYFKNNFDSKTE